jgi:hypothetical protein
MSTPVIAASELIDELARRSYEPQEDAPEFIRADLTFTVLDSVLGTVRVIVDDGVAVIGFDRNGVTMWSARFDNAAPLAAIAGAIDAAEADARVAFGA